MVCLKFYQKSSKTGDRFTTISDLQNNEECVLFQAGNRQLIRKIYLAEKNAKNTHNEGKYFSNRTMFEAIPSASYLFCYDRLSRVTFSGHRVVIT